MMVATTYKNGNVFQHFEISLIQMHRMKEDIMKIKIY